MRIGLPGLLLPCLALLACEQPVPVVEPVSCDPGLVAEGDLCVDIDECLTDNGGCEDLCENLVGSYSCDCSEGILQSDGSCSDPCDDLEAYFSPVEEPLTEPPYWGTVWFSPDIITEEDPSAFEGLTYTGTGLRIMFDRRSASWVELEAHLFDARFGETTTIEIQVNPEFSAEEAEVEALFYGQVIGQIPGFFFADLETVWIHRGYEGFGGGNNNLLIHTEMGEEYIRDGVLEEVFLHEGTHTSVDAHHSDNPLWLAAQEADGMFISQYAQEHPNREDLSETVGPYLGMRFRSERMSEELNAIVNETLPNRVMYLDCLDLSMEILP